MSLYSFGQQDNKVYPEIPADDSMNVKMPFLKHLANNHWLEYKFKDGHIHFDPWVEFTYSSGGNDDSFVRNGRGIFISGKVNKIHFTTGLQENQSGLFDFEKSLALQSKAIPSEGKYKINETGDVFDFANVFGWVEANAANWLNIKFGHYKNFIGHGYRSLLLSDFSNVYPHLETTIHFDSTLFYTASLGKLYDSGKENIGGSSESPHRVKPFNWYKLTWEKKHYSISLFHSTIWNRYSDIGMGQRRPVRLESYLPFPLTERIQKNLKFFSLSGIIASVQLKGFKLYGQWVKAKDSKKAATQIGLLKKIKGKQTDLSLGIDRNILPEFFYEGVSLLSGNSLLKYTFMNQSLGHPNIDVARIIENIFYFNFRHRKLYLNAWFVFTNYNFENSSLFDPWMSEIKYSIINTEFSYRINPKNNLDLLLGFVKRTQKDLRTVSNNYMYLGLRTQIFRRLRDYIPAHTTPSMF